MREVSIREVSFGSTMLTKAILICGLATHFTNAAVIKGENLFTNALVRKHSFARPNHIQKFKTPNYKSVLIFEIIANSEFIGCDGHI